MTLDAGHSGGMNLRGPQWESIPSLWGESLLAMRFIALGPDGQVIAWPRSKWRRLWLRYRPWRRWYFIEDNLIAKQSQRNATLAQILHAPEWAIPVRRLSKEEIIATYGPGAEALDPDDPALD